MENHPIPQDVTGFKFKLIGSVTVKQFLYLLGFGILATVAFAIPVNFLIRIPFMILFGGIGFALAFIPIEGRPLDTMLMNFAKAIPSENRYLYRKRGVNLSKYTFLDTTVKAKTLTAQQTQTQTTTTEQNDDKRAMLISRLRNSGYAHDDDDAKALTSINSFFKEDTAKPEASKINQAKLAQIYSGNIVTPAGTGSTNDTTVTIQKQPLPAEEVKPDISVEVKLRNQQIAAAKHQAEEELKAKLAESKPKKQDAPTTAKKEADLKLTDINPVNTQPLSIPKNDVGWKESNSLPGGFPSLPDVGNVVLGLVRDSRGKTLPNVLVEVVDGAGIPVRAFKTNALGQFASATPLPNGTYKIYFEDPAKLHEITPVDINLTGEIFQPVEAVSVDDRERLRRELFGGGTAPNVS